jgi:hypothetical protein
MYSRKPAAASRSCDKRMTWHAGDLLAPGGATVLLGAVAVDTHIENLDAHAKRHRTSGISVHCRRFSTACSQWSNQPWNGEFITVS